MGPLDARDPIRISDSERTEAIRRLNQYFAEGRLDFEENSARLDEIYAAKTDVDLERVFRDLPKPPAAATRQRRAWGVRSRVERTVAITTPALICTAIWGLTGAHGSFWPEWVWFGCGVVMLRSVRHGHRQREADVLGGTGAPGLPSGDDERLILTAVFADIVSSTERAATLGDRRWREILTGFEQGADGALARHGGHKLFTKGDEVVGTFRSPAQAVAYARDLRDEAGTLGLDLRVGVHTGEVEQRQGDLSGIALHIGQRVSEQAQPNEILVSSTVRDLAHGSGIDFSDRGEHDLRGVPGSFHLYAVD